MAFNFIAPRVRLVDDNGYATREFYLFLQSLFSATGGLDIDTLLLANVSGPSDQFLTITDALRNEIGSIPPPVPPPPFPDDLSPVPQPIFIQLDDVLPAFSALNDQIAMLRAEINDLKQGPHL